MRRSHFVLPLPFSRRKYARHVYLLTDAATPVEGASQLGDIVNMYADASMECKLHFVGLGVEAFSRPAVKQEAGAEVGYIRIYRYIYVYILGIWLAFTKKSTLVHTIRGICHKALYQVQYYLVRTSSTT